MLYNFSCLETRLKLLSIESLLHSSLNLAFTHGKLHNIIVFGMAYSIAAVIEKMFIQRQSYLIIDPIWIETLQMTAAHMATW